MPKSSTLASSASLAFAFGLMLFVGTTASAGDFFDQTGASCHCPVCDHVCELKAEKVDEEKTCFEVESKVICIPRVVFPWQKSKKSACASCDACDGQGCTSCVHNGARLRRICVVKKEKYKCPSCKYTWNPVERGRCCESGCASIPEATIRTVPAPSSEHAPPSEHAPAAVPAPTDATRHPQSVVEPISAADYFRLSTPSVSQLPTAPVLSPPNSALIER